MFRICTYITKTKLWFHKVPKLFSFFQLESFDKNKDGEIELSEMAKLVSLCNLLVLLLLVLYSLKIFSL